ncbi:glycosyl hydrolase family 28-related protein [Pseudomonas chlororaphis]|uniref:glycosyl hydrolase family 28-related protein n=1 Tax=Pseudomonas chlororaphis TaxID=587753 RepID=UPI000F56DBC8|nr:glycosyl hydrolase family 28-related protein [Pseudomonas chlororaphis]AZC49760.1 hypothetical protein C4K35_2176 [Pseudomonas chlororaphis subsp. piscium]AZC56341.1 hypothetical protein C4K34_2175 [Pseudomonas chlororaphis subsp. piscium]AZC74977.1 hypothetical protein C4K31_2073 [Pseudomonas chlororaphis subsp. piscium]AZC94813.1 hypothetical protein C4K28_2084 [Pseudomonas chlororaphis subsp. piscium]MBP5059711.1 right-handed parallel beta-helix repeat-containing protein [Pseudomonas chl
MNPKKNKEPLPTNRRRLLSLLAATSALLMSSTARSAPAAYKNDNLKDANFAKNIEALKTLAPTSTQSIFVINHTLSGDGGGGHFFWDEKSTDNADGALVIKSSLSPNGRWHRQLQTKNLINVRWFGAVGNGVTDDIEAIDQALNAIDKKGGTLYFPDGNYLISKTIHLNKDNLSLLGNGSSRTILTLDKNSTAEYAIYSDRPSSYKISELTVDVNQKNRANILGDSRRSCGIVLCNCNDSSINNCIVKNTIGDTKNYSGVAFAIAGRSSRSTISGCSAIDCGPDLTRKSDGFFTSGEQILTSNCIASGVTDTAFVIESSRLSGLTGCTATNCSAGAAISHADIEYDSSGNFINGLSINNYNATVTGAISINIPIEIKSKTTLINTTISNVIINTKSGHGPAINARSISTNNQITGLSLTNIRIKNPGTQGILAKAENLMISNCDIESSNDASIQIDGSTQVLIQSCRATQNKSPIAIAIIDSQKVIIKDSVIDCPPNGEWGVYCYGKETEAIVMNNIITGFKNGDIGCDTGAIVTATRPLLTKI